MWILEFPFLNYGLWIQQIIFLQRGWFLVFAKCFRFLFLVSMLHELCSNLSTETPTLGQLHNTLACHRILIKGFWTVAVDLLRGVGAGDAGGAMPPHCALNGVLRGHFQGIKMLQWNKSLRSFMSNFCSFWSPCLTP